MPRGGLSAGLNPDVDREGDFLTTGAGALDSLAEPDQIAASGVRCLAPAHPGGTSDRALCLEVSHGALRCKQQCAASLLSRRGPCRRRRHHHRPSTPPRAGSRAIADDPPRKPEAGNEFLRCTALQLAVFATRCPPGDRRRIDPCHARSYRRPLNSASRFWQSQRRCSRATIIRRVTAEELAGMLAGVPVDLPTAFAWRSLMEPVGTARVPVTPHLQARRHDRYRVVPQMVSDQSRGMRRHGRSEAGQVNLYSSESV